MRQLIRLGVMYHAALTLLLIAGTAYASGAPSAADVSALVALAKGHAWVPFAALVIGLIVRLLKSDTKIPIDIPPRWRTPLVYVLGIAAAILEKSATGTAWVPALIDGMLSALLAQNGHLLLIESLRGGREVAIPGLIVPGAAPGPKKPITLPPTLPVLMLAFVLGGCGLFFKALDLAADKAKCVVANQDLPEKVIFVKCAIEDPEKYLDLLAVTRTATKAALQRQAAAAAAAAAAMQPATDAGAPIAASDAGSKPIADAASDGAAK